jgi:CRP-like cAMP-binding protein
MSLLTGERRLATVRAQQDATLIVVPKQLFAEVIAANPDTSTHLAESLAKRLDDLRSISGAQPSEGANPSNLRTRIKAFFGIR